VADRKKEIEIKREKRLGYKRHSTEDSDKEKETGERKRDKEREKRVRDTE
jgi:hypothetical protein